jgi:hypothetical protein
MYNRYQELKDHDNNNNHNLGDHKNDNEFGFIWLTTNPIKIRLNHRVYGNVYVFDVPRWVIKKSGGFKKNDYASEIKIPNTLWKYVKFVGRSFKWENKLVEFERDEFRLSNQKGVNILE